MLTVKSEIAKAVLERIVSSNNKISEVSVGWLNFEQVIFMENPLQESLKIELLENFELDYYESKATPHNKADNGFSSEIGKFAISFPVG